MVWVPEIGKPIMEERKTKKRQLICASYTLKAYRDSKHHALDEIVIHSVHIGNDLLGQGVTHLLGAVVRAEELKNGSIEQLEC